MKVFTPNRLDVQFENDFASRQVMFSQGICKFCCVVGQSGRRKLLTAESRLQSFGFAVNQASVACAVSML
jgi:hypothetical protein